jgi:hypothetical protein
LNKFVTIIGGIVEHGLAPRIAGTDFDARSRVNQNGSGIVACCVFLDGVSTNTKKMHQVLSQLLPPDHLQDVFSRICAYVDQKVPALFLTTASTGKFTFPTTDDGKRQMLLEVEAMTFALNELQGVRPWDFTVVTVVERKLDYVLRQNSNGDVPSHAHKETEFETNGSSVHHPVSPEDEEIPKTNANLVENHTEEETISSASNEPIAENDEAEMSVDRKETEQLKSMQEPEPVEQIN